jgi:hypothetical protein
MTEPLWAGARERPGSDVVPNFLPRTEAQRCANETGRSQRWRGLTIEPEEDRNGAVATAHALRRSR